MHLVIKEFELVGSKGMSTVGTPQYAPDESQIEDLLRQIYLRVENEKLYKPKIQAPIIHPGWGDFQLSDLDVQFPVDQLAQLQAMAIIQSNSNLINQVADPHLSPIVDAEAKGSRGNNTFVHNPHVDLPPQNLKVIEIYPELEKTCDSTIEAGPVVDCDFPQDQLALLASLHAQGGPEEKLEPLKNDIADSFKGDLSHEVRLIFNSCHSDSSGDDDLLELIEDSEEDDMLGMVPFETQMMFSSPIRTSQSLILQSQELDSVCEDPSSSELSKYHETMHTNEIAMHTALSEIENSEELPVTMGNTESSMEERLRDSHESYAFFTQNCQTSQENSTVPEGSSEIQFEEDMKVQDGTDTMHAFFTQAFSQSEDMQSEIGDGYECQIAQNTSQDSRSPQLHSEFNSFHDFESVGSQFAEAIDVTPRKESASKEETPIEPMFTPLSTPVQQDFVAPSTSKRHYQTSPTQEICEITESGNKKIKILSQDESLTPDPIQIVDSNSQSVLSVESTSAHFREGQLEMQKKIDSTFDVHVAVLQPHPEQMEVEQCMSIKSQSIK